MSDPADVVDLPDLSREYPPWVELAAIALTAEYCATHGVTDPLDVRFVHYYALAVVLSQEPIR